MAVNPKPDGYHTLTPYLVVREANKAIEFLKQSFAAVETERFDRPDGTVKHVELRIGDSMVMMGEPEGEMQPMPAMLHVYVDDTDAAYHRAIEAGATSMMEPADQFYGDRNAGVKDPCGNVWWIATHVEDVLPEELKRRAEAAAKKQAAG